MSGYDDQVFVNCPFDEDFEPLFRALVFAIHDCGLVARSALEQSDSGAVRLSKIESIIGASRLSIHDISRTELDVASGLPQFNMPLELGLVLGARRFGTARHRRKACLVLDSESFRYQVYLSDIGGQDIGCHRNDPAVAIQVVRDWLSHHLVSDVILPGPKTMIRRYGAFQAALPVMLDDVQIGPDELIYNDYTTLLVSWLALNPWGV
ncbi:hypothetical protein [Rubrivirga sp.]|uniref:hypothetical protein n=1 Tax=Rubrivirga sp. TaxID=1885344 RepID=UPI003B51C717